MISVVHGPSSSLEEGGICFRCYLRHSRVSSKSVSSDGVPRFVSFLELKSLNVLKFSKVFVRMLKYPVCTATVLGKIGKANYNNGFQLFNSLVFSKTCFQVHYLNACTLILYLFADLLVVNFYHDIIICVILKSLLSVM